MVVRLPLELHSSYLNTNYIYVHNELRVGMEHDEGCRRRLVDRNCVDRLTVTSELLASGPGDGSGRYVLQCHLTCPRSCTVVVQATTWPKASTRKLANQFGTIPSHTQARRGKSNCMTQTTSLPMIPRSQRVYCYSDLTGALLWSTPNVGTYPWNTKYGGYEVSNDNNNVYIAAPDWTDSCFKLGYRKSCMGEHTYTVN